MKTRIKRGYRSHGNMSVVEGKIHYCGHRASRRVTVIRHSAPVFVREFRFSEDAERFLEREGLEPQAVNR